MSEEFYKLKSINEQMVFENDQLKIQDFDEFEILCDKNNNSARSYIYQEEANDQQQVIENDSFGISPDHEVEHDLPDNQ